MIADWLNWRTRGPTHRHRARKQDYTVIGEAMLQSSGPIEEPMALTVYVGREGGLWVRPTAEFEDGRFEPLP